MLVRTLLFVVPGIALAACDHDAGKHEIVRAGSQTFLLNKETGDAKVIDGTSLLAVEVPKPTAGSEPYKKAKIWPEESINDLPEVKFKFRTKYRDAAMLWSMEAGPFPGELEKIYKATLPLASVQPTVIFELYDDEGFRTGESIEVKIRSGSRMVNEKNEVMYLTWSGTQAMSPDTYQSAAFVSTKWYGFEKG